ncbi:MAG: hypothetical protein OQK82_02115 [Candidatus Pacearchaeota archaeon]|nr:hypothetical protein [Candidatus Pacearchaeota archaeon]
MDKRRSEQLCSQSSKLLTKSYQFCQSNSTLKPYLFFIFRMDYTSKNKLDSMFSTNQNLNILWEKSFKPIKQRGEKCENQKSKQE